MSRIIVNILILLNFPYFAVANIFEVGASRQYKQIKAAVAVAAAGDTIIVHKGEYKEGNILIDKPLVLIGKDTPVLDGQKKYEVFTVKSSDVIIEGFKIQYSGNNAIDEPCGIKVYGSKNVIIRNNFFYDNYFAINLQNSSKCRVEHNKIVAFGKDESSIGNGINCWKGDSLLIIGNDITGHRDGIYFEFVTNSLIWLNYSEKNVRYGLHFMFSDKDTYISNTFKNNGAGVAVMFTKNVTMIGNRFLDNWGESSYGLLLKEISDCYIFNNLFEQNSTALFLEGANRFLMEGNQIKNNGWGMKIQASSMDNVIRKNNFLGNTFDMSTNGSLVLNTFEENYWDKYEGYDLDRNGIGDVPFRPLSLYSVIVESNPPAMILFRSFIVSLLDRAEKVLPSLTPENFIDNMPRMKAFPFVS